MKKGILLLMVTVLVFFLAFSCAEEKSALLRNGVCFGDTVQVVREKETFSLSKEDVDGVDSVWGAENVTLYGLKSSTINYMFNSDNELFEVYEYFQNKASIKNGKKGYQTVQEELERELGSPLAEKDHVILNTAGFDVDDFVDMQKQRKAKVDITERDMWVVELGNYVVTVDHIGVTYSSSDLYKHYLFIVAEEKHEAETVTKEFAKPANYKFLDSTVLGIAKKTDTQTLCSDELRETILVSLAIDYLKQTEQSKMILQPDATFIGYVDQTIYAVLPVVEGETVLFEVDMEYTMCKYYIYESVDPVRNERIISSNCGTNYWGTERKKLESALYALMQ